MQDDERDRWVASMLEHLLEEGFDEDGHFRVRPEWAGRPQDVRGFNMSAVMEYMQMPIRTYVDKVVDDYEKEGLK